MPPYKFVYLLQYINFKLKVNPGYLFQLYTTFLLTLEIIDKHLIKLFK